MRAGPEDCPDLSANAAFEGWASGCGWEDEDGYGAWLDEQFDDLEVGDDEDE